MLGGGPRSRLRRTAAAGAALTALALLATAGCSSGGDEAPPTEQERNQPSGGGPVEAADGDALTALWHTPFEPGEVDQTWVTAATLVVSADGGVSGYDVATGEQRWQLELPRGVDDICLLSPSPNRAGIGGIAFGNVDGCTSVGALNADSGELLWHEQLAEHGPTPFDTQISVGESVLTLTGRCGEVLRYHATTGDRLPTMQAGDWLCRHSAALSGRYVVVTNRPAPDLTRLPERARELGWIPDYPSGAGLAVYDAESGERLHAQEVDEQAAVHQIVTEDPLVVDLIVDDIRTFQVYDDAGRPTVELDGAAIGDWGGRAGYTTSAGEGVVVLRYGAKDPYVHAYDTATGERLWSLPRDPRTGALLGVRDGTLLGMGTRDFDPSNPLGSGDQYLWAVDLRTGEQREHLGVVREVQEGTVYLSQQQPIAWDDERFYVREWRTGLVAYEFPS